MITFCIKNKINIIKTKNLIFHFFSFSIGDNLFKTQVREITNAGFTQLIQSKEVQHENDEILKELKVNNSFKIM